MPRKEPNFRFAGFAGEWETRKLGEISRIARGSSPRPISDPKWFDEDSDVGWIRISDVTEQNGRIHYLEQKISKLGQEKTRVLIEKHLLLSIAASVGKPLINYVKTGVHDGFIIFYDNKFNIEYMYHWLEFFQNKWLKYAQPGTQVNLNSNIVRNQKILIPSIQEQEKIGELFEVLDGLIGNQETYIQTLEEMKRSFLQGLFPQKGQTRPDLRFAGFEGDWEEEKLKDNADFTIGYTPSTKDESNFGGNHTWYSISDFKNKYINKSARTLSDKSYREDKLVEKGSILMSFKLSIGMLAITETDCFTNEAIVAMKFENRDKQFMYYRLKTVNFLRYANRAAQGFTINANGLNSVKILLPSLAEQEKIGEFFEGLDTRIDLENRKLRELNDAKKALLQNCLV